MRAIHATRLTGPGWWILALVLAGALGLALVPAPAHAGPGTISGTIIRQSNGLPVPFAGVELRDQNGGGVAATVAEADGTYTLVDVPPGTYLLVAYSVDQGLAITFYGNVGLYFFGTQIPVGEDQDVTGIDVSLPPGGTFTGRVFRAGTNTGLSGPDTFVAVLDWFNASIFYFEIPVTNPSGNYTLPSILHPDVTYSVSARRDDSGMLWFNGKPNWWLSDQVCLTDAVCSLGPTNVNFPLSLAATITGTITDGNLHAGLADVEVTLFDSATFSFVASTMTDVDGVFSLENLPPGSYKLWARRANYVTRFFSGTSLTGTPIFDEATVITTTPNATITNRDIELPQGGDVEGTVYDGPGTSTPIPFAWVEAFEAGTNTHLEGVPADVNGHYSFDGRLPPGDVLIRVNFDGFPVTFHDQKATFNTADHVSVTAGGSTNIDFHLAGGGIQGQITNGADGGAPLPGATVLVFDTNGNFITSTTTVGLGGYATGHTLLPGTYYVQVIYRESDFSLIDTYYADPLEFDGSYDAALLGLDRTTASIVTVVAGADVANVNVELKPGGTVSGTIRNKATNAPLANVRVFVDRFDASNFSGEFSVLTDAQGNYTVRGLHNGDWIASTRPAGFQAAVYSGVVASPTGDSGSGKFIRILNGNTVTNVSMNLTPGGGSISGQITRDDDDQPVPAGTQVQARGPYPRTAFVTSTSTDSNGNYTLTGLPPGMYTVEGRGRQAPNGFAIGWYPTGTRARAAGIPVTVVNNVVTPGVDFQLLGFSGGESPRQITGIVMNVEGKRVPFAGIGAFDKDSGSTVRFPTANGDGSFTINTLRPGQYYVGAETETEYQQRFYNGNQLNGAASLLDVTSSDLNAGNVALPGNPATISGKVTRAGSTTPIVGANVVALNWFQTGLGGATTTGDGTFLIRGLPADLYKVRVLVPGSIVGFYNALATASPTFTGGVFVTVDEGGDTPNVNIGLAAGGGAIAGVVKDAGSSNPVAGASVFVRDAAGNAVRGVSTLADGSYLVTGLATGDYSVAVNAPTQNLATQWYAGQPHQNAADLVHVTAPATTGGVNFQLSDEQGKISGTILDTDGSTPLAGAGIVVLDAETLAFVRGAGPTGTSGQYEAAGLPADRSYVIQARRPGYVREFHDDVFTVAEATAILVTNGGNAFGNDFTLGESGNVIGNIAYAGPQTGSVRARLYGDVALTDLKAEVVLGGTTFPRSLTFLLSGPDTNGLPPGTYYLSAFIDSIPNGVQDVGEAAAVYGAVPGVPDPLDVASTVNLALPLLLQNPSPPSILQFSLANYSGTEGGPVTITVTRTGSTAGVATVEFEISEGTAFVGSHYTLPPLPHTLTFTAGQSQTTFSVATINDFAINTPRTVLLRLSGPTGNAQLGDRDTAIITILNNDVPGVFKFTAASVSAPDLAAPVNVGVSRTGGAGSDVTITYQTGTLGTAVPGVDYVAIPPTALPFIGNQLTNAFPVQILGNFIAGDTSKTVELLLSPGSPGTTIGTPNRIFLTITNNDVGGGLRFELGSYSILETAGSLFVNVTRPPGLADGVTVQVVPVNGTAKLGVDFGAPSPSLLEFGAGATVKPVQVPLIAGGNALAVANRTFSLKLQNPTGGATLGGPSTATVTITKVGIRFNHVALEALEPAAPPAGFTTVTATVARTGAAAPASVRVSSTEESADSPIDYQLINPATGSPEDPFTLNFTTGQSSKTFQVRVLNNGASTTNQTLRLILSVLSDPVGKPDNIQLTILNRELPELALTQFAPPLVAILGKPFSVPNTVRNASGASAGASVLQFWLSENDILGDADDTPLVTRNVSALGAGATSSTSTTMTISQPPGPGVYRMIAKVDVNNIVTPEQDEPNNTVLSPDLVTVVASLVKTFNVTGSLTHSDCTSRPRDGSRIVQGTLVFASQVGELLTGTLTLNYPLSPGLKTAGPVTGTILSTNGHLDGVFNYTTTQGSTVISKGQATLVGDVSGPTFADLTVTLGSVPPGPPETCAFTAALQSHPLPVAMGLLRFHHDATAGGLEEEDGLFVATHVFPAALNQYRALFDVGPDTAPFPAHGTVLFTGPGGLAGSGLDTTPGAAFLQLVPTAGQYQSPWVDPPDAAPGGDWTVQYDGLPYDFDGTPDPEAALRLVVPMPTFVLNNSNPASTVIQQVTWVYKVAAESDLPGPPDFMRTMRLQLLNPCGAVLHDSQVLDPATTTRVLSPPVNLASVAKVQFLYTDDRDNLFSIPFGNIFPDPCSMFEFSSPSYSAAENVTPANVTVRRVGNLSLPASVDVVASDGTATSEDYTAGTVTLQFAPNVTQLVRPVQILNNVTPEGPETVILHLENASVAAIGPLNTAVLTINDEEPRVSFNASAFSVTEGTATVTITVLRTGATNTTVSVPYATSDGTAIAGVDYLATSGIMTFTPGQTTKTFTVTILNDALSEGPQTVNLSLGTPIIGGGPGTPVTATLTINDTDPTTRSAFSQASYSVPENGGSILVTVVRTGSTGGFHTVGYQTLNGSGQVGVDCLDATGELIFAPGELSKTFSVTVLPNPGSTDNRSVQLSLFGTDIGTPSDATLWIVNVDP